MGRSIITILKKNFFLVASLIAIPYSASGAILFTGTEGKLTQITITESFSVTMTTNPNSVSIGLNFQNVYSTDQFTNSDFDLSAYSPTGDGKVFSTSSALNGFPSGFTTVRDLQIGFGSSNGTFSIGEEIVFPVGTITISSSTIPLPDQPGTGVVLVNKVGGDPQVSDINTSVSINPIPEPGATSFVLGFLWMFAFIRNRERRS